MIKKFIILSLVSSFFISAQASSIDSKSDASNLFVRIANKVIPSVVNIYTTARIRNPRMGMGMGRENGGDDLWRRFFEDFFGGEGFNGMPNGVPRGAPIPRQNPQAPKVQSLGSGFVIEVGNSGGLILTNNHVVEGAEEIFVKFTESLDEKDTEAEIIGRDSEFDVALLKVKTRRKLEAVELSDSEKLEVGEWIAALGNPFGHGHSISHGIVSAKERTLPGGYGKYLQVDAPINPGNSGGPLVNLDGKVVGINNAIDARGPGIGFAIPINQVKAILPQLKEKGKVDRGYIGVSVGELSPDLAKTLKLDENLKAPIITNVMVGQPAAKAGLKAYDVITEANGQKVHNSTELVAAITSVTVGQTVKLKVLRSGAEKNFEIKVALRPDFGKEEIRKTPKKEKGLDLKKIDTGMEVSQIEPQDARELGLPENYKGVVVSDVVPGSAAAQAGITAGDVVLEADQKPIKKVEDFYKIISQKKRYLLRIRKQDDSGQELFAVVTLNLAASEDN